jgi:hypothetical protein
MVGPASAPPSTFTIGVTSPGANSGTFSGITGSKFPLTQTGKLTALSIYWNTTGVTFLLGLYADNAGAPGVLLASTATATATSGWNTLPVTNGPTVAAGNYWIVVQNQSGISGNYDTTGFGAWNNGASWTGTLPSPFPVASSGAFQYSMNATFAPATLFTIGATSQGASSGVYTPITGIQVTLAQSATLQSMSMFSGSAGTPFFIGIYTDNGSNFPGSLIASSALVSSSVVGLMTASIPSRPLIAPGTYWIGVQYQQFATSWTGYYDTPVGLGAFSACPWDGVAMAATWPSGSSTGPYHYSIYATLGS